MRILITWRWGLRFTSDQVRKRILLAMVLFGTGIAVLAHTAPFPFVLDAAFPDTVVWSIPEDASGRTIYLTFDDGPNPTVTPDLLQLLREENVRATFFLIGDYVTEQTAPIVRRTFEDGHAVGLHSGRRWLFLESAAEIAETLKAQSSKIERFAGTRPCPIFRPHAGWRSGSMIRGAYDAGHTIVGWGWRSWDWPGLHEQSGPVIADRLLEQAAPGRILVLHDGHHEDPRADRRYTLDSARRVIRELRRAGYGFERLCDAEALKCGSCIETAGN